MKKILITGISGCIGHYLFDVISKHQDYQLYLLTRNPQKLKFDPGAFRNITILKNDLDIFRKEPGLLKDVNYVIHMAAQWGGSSVNYDQTLSFFSLLDPEQCEKVIYFSTASILGPDHRPREEAEQFGRGYIQSKYQLFKKLPGLKIYPKVITLFPTWVLGGDEKHPYSHASAGILKLRKWLWLLKFFTVDLSFHFIHARDIALITNYLLENEVGEKEFVLGNRAVTAGEFIQKTCLFFNQHSYFQIPIPLFLVHSLSFITGRRLHTWDKYCLDKKHFVYKTVNAASFGIKSDLESLEQILSDALPRAPIHEHGKI